MDFIRIENMCSSKDTIKKMQMQTETVRKELQNIYE